MHAVHQNKKKEEEEETEKWSEIIDINSYCTDA